MTAQRTKKSAALLAREIKRLHAFVPDICMLAEREGPEAEARPKFLMVPNWRTSELEKESPNHARTCFVPWFFSGGVREEGRSDGRAWEELGRLSQHLESKLTGWKIENAGFVRPACAGGQRPQWGSGEVRQRRQGLVGAQAPVP